MDISNCDISDNTLFYEMSLANIDKIVLKLKSIANVENEKKKCLNFDEKIIELIIHNIKESYLLFKSLNNGQDILLISHAYSLIINAVKIFIENFRSEKLNEFDMDINNSFSCFKLLKISEERNDGKYNDEKCIKLIINFIDMAYISRFNNTLNFKFEFNDNDIIIKNDDYSIGFSYNMVKCYINHIIQAFSKFL